MKINQLKRFHLSLILLLASLFSLSLFAETFQRGDVAPRGAPDGLLNAADSLILQQMILGNIVPSVDEIKLGDVAPLGIGDGALNAGDIAVQQRAILGLISLGTIDISALPAPTLNSGLTPTTTNPYQITGIATADSSVDVYVDGLLYQISVGADGTFAANVYLHDGVNNIYAVENNGAEISPQSDTLQIQYDNVIDRNNLPTNISVDTVWTPGTLLEPYIVSSTLTIDPGVSLTILPGAELKFESGATLNVSGNLTVVGSELLPVALTSAQVSPAKNNWQGINVLSGGNAVIDFAIIEYAINGIYFQSGSSGTVSNSVIQNNTDGIEIRGETSPVIGQNNTITQNTNGFYLQSASSTNPTPNITGNKIFDNSSYNIYSRSFVDGINTVLDVQGNYWGSVDAAIIALKMRPATSSSYPHIDFGGYLDVNGAVAAGETLIGFIDADTTLTENTIYEVLGDVTVVSGVTLTIPEGVTLRTTSYIVDINVEGNLIVNGTSLAPVIFTSALASPAKGSWQGLNVLSGGTATINYAVIEYAYYGIDFQFGSSGSVSNTVIQINNDGIVVYGTSSPVIGPNNTITQNNYGISLFGSGGSNPSPSITGNQIFENTTYNINTGGFTDGGNVVLDIRGNYWGGVDFAIIASKIRPATSVSYPYIDFGAFLDVNGLVIAGETLVGPIKVDTTLTANTTYELLSDIDVPLGVTLTIPSGVTLKFNAGSNTQLQVDGALIVQGTVSSPVILTAGQAVPAPNDWQGIYIGATATKVVIDYAEVRYADRGIEFKNVTVTNSAIDFCDILCVRNSVIENNYNVGIYISGASPSIQNNTIQNNRSQGIYIANTSNPVISNGNIITGQAYGVYIRPTSRSLIYNSFPIINGNGIYGNTTYDMYSYNYFDAENVSLDMTGNWWGTTDPTEIAINIYDNVDHATRSPLVEFNDYLNAMNGTPVAVNSLSGEFVSNTTLVSGTTYEILGNITVPLGVTLTIPEGVTLKFTAGTNSKLLVEGALLVQGSIESPVIFTSGQAVPAPNDWQGIYIGATATKVVIDYAEVRYADRGIEFKDVTAVDSVVGACDTLCVRNTVIEDNYNSGIYISGSSPTIQNNTVQNNRYYGIYIADASNPVINNGNIITGQNYGVYIVPASRSLVNNPAPMINGNGIYGNTSYDLYAYNYFDAISVELDVTGNWWGTTDSTVIAAKVYDNVDNPTISPTTNFRDYLDSYLGSPVVGVDALLGIFSTDTTLTSGRVYDVLGNIIVPTGVTLTIEPGVTLRFVAGFNSRLQVDGALLIQGSAGLPVILTSGQTVPAPNDWQGIYISATATQVVIDYVEVRYADRGIEFKDVTVTDSVAGACDILCIRNSVIENNINSGIYISGSSPSILSNTIQNNVNGYGIYIFNTSNPLISNGNVITGQNYGVHIRPTSRSAAYNSYPIINGNGIYGNSSYDLYSYNYYDAANVILDVTGNWWGTVDPAEIATNIYDNINHATRSPVVDFSGYLNAMNGTPVAVNNLSGTLTVNTELVAGEVYDVLDSLVVQSGVTLTIPAGTTLRFVAGSNSKLQIDGTLLVQGSEASPVVFTSGQAEPAPNDWQGIYIGATATQVVIDYAEVRFADRGIEFKDVTVVDSVAGACDNLCVRNSVIENNYNTGIYISGASPSIQANIIQNNGSYGIYIADASNPVINDGNIITGQNYGVYIKPASRALVNNSAPVINGNGIFGNTSHDLYAYNYFNAVNVTLDVTGNWWGTTNPTEIAANIYDNVESTAYSPVVDFKNYLDGLLGSPVGGANTLLGTFSVNTTLMSGATYDVLSSIIVPNGVTLTIESGATLRFIAGSNSQLQVDGALMVQGSAESPVIFTTGQAVPAPNDWQGIFISATATQVVIDYAEVRYADRGIEFKDVIVTDSVVGACDILCVRNSVIENNSYSGVYISGSSPSILNNIIQNNTSYGIYIVNASNPVVKDGNTITGQSYGVYIRPTSRSLINNSFPLINGNNIYGNATYNLYSYNYSDAENIVLDVTGNWWGTAAPATIAAKIYDNVEHATRSPVVDFSDYLDAMNGSPVTVNTLLGEFASSTTLVSGTTYEVLGDIIVPLGVTLTIPEGVTLQFNAGSNTLLQVDGVLMVQGTEASPVIFTSGQIVPAPNDWQGIFIGATATQVVIDYAEVRFADRGIEFKDVTVVDTVAGACDNLCVRNSVIENNYNTGIYISGASPSIQANIIQNNGSYGIYIADASNPVIDNGNIITGQNYGVYIVPVSYSLINNPVPVINGNAIYGNTNYDLYASNYFDATNVVLDVTGNWWGSTDSSVIAANVYDNVEQEAYSPIVDYSYYLDAQNGSPVTFSIIRISNVSHSQTTVNPFAGDTADISFDLQSSLPTTAYLNIYTEQSRLLVRQTTPQSVTVGSNSLSWDGRDLSNNFVIDEAYVYEIVADNGTTTESTTAPIAGGTNYPNNAYNDTDYNTFSNDYFKTTINLVVDSRVSLSVKPSGSTVWQKVVDSVPYESGVQPIIWDGRDLNGTILTGATGVWIHDTVRLPVSNVIIVRGNVPNITGTGVAPDIEVKSNPYRIEHTYEQISQIIFNIDQDAYITAKLLPPGITDVNSTQAFAVIDNVLKSAESGGLPIGHIIEWTGYEASDTNNILISDEGAYTFIIQATGSQTGFMSTYRGSINLYH